MGAEGALVLGGGIFGVTAALELRERGWRVTLVEPGAIPRPLASSTDRSKVVRADYGSDRELSRLARKALEGWRRWNRQRFPRPLFHETGFLLLSRTPMEEGGFELSSFRSLEGQGMAVERVDESALRTRFPAWNARIYPDGYLSREAGWVESGEAVRLLALEAGRRGVEIVRDRATAVVARGGRVQGARLDGRGVVPADAVVVAAGAWTPRLVPELQDILRPRAMPVHLFLPRDPTPFRPPAFPVWGADIARTGWYGFPAGEDGVVKVGHHGRGWDDDPEDPAALPAHWEERTRAFLRESLPALASAPLRGTRACFYCDSVDGDFWIARHPDTAGLVVASGGSGHGFKFGPVLGEIVADAVEGVEHPLHHRFRWRPDAAAATEDARYRGD